VVIIGSGFGGLFAAKAFKRLPVKVTLIDRVNHHQFQPLLFHVATGILSSGEIAPATRDVLRRHHNVSVEMADVTNIDLAARTVTATQMGYVRVFPYDSLIVAAGAQTTYFGHDEYDKWSTGMKTIDDALELRGRIFVAFEQAEFEPDEERRRQLLTFAIVGGGPTGVEMAGQILELSRHALRNNFRSIDPASARVLLFEGGDRLLSAFSERVSKMAERDLTHRGAEIHLRTTVIEMDDAGIVVRHPDGSTERIETSTKVWAAGMRASPLGGLLATAPGVQTTKSGQIKVEPDCSLPGHPEVFVVGDLMSLGDLPGMAEVAMQSGKHAAHCIRRRACGDAGMHPFKYRDLGSMAATSRFRAVAQIGRLSFGGVIGWLLWVVVHLTFLTGFKNRLTTLFQWMVTFLARGRAERVITEQQIEARQALQRQTAQVGGGVRNPWPATSAPDADRAVGAGDRAVSADRAVGADRAVSRADPGAARA
jgi:NADH dehydrogenase